MTTSAYKDGPRVTAQTFVQVVDNHQGFNKIQSRADGEDRVFVAEGRLGGGTSCMAAADGERKPGCGSELPRGVFAFTVACCC